jgi:hypothetical protein
MEKKCTKCGVVKSLDEFFNDKSKKDGKQSRCKDCDKEYKENNKEYNKTSRKYYENNKEKIKNANKKYREKNKEKIKNANKKYKEKNKEKIKNANKKYREKNKEKKREYLKKYLKERRKTDFLFRLRGNISANIKESLNKKGYTKRNKTYNILKCEFNFFMKWINGIASNGHTYGIGELHLDHVIPISLAETEDEVILLNHYSNYQLLSADENVSKGNRYVNPVNLARVLEHHPNPDKIREIHARL